MATEVIKLAGQVGLADAVRRGAEVLAAGGLVAFPTETVYGLAARVDRAKAMARLRSVKSRSAEKAFTVHIGSRAAVEGFVPELSGLAIRLIRKAWPGPLTLIVEVKDPTSAPVMAGLNGSAAAAMYYENTIGLRCPDDPVAGALLRAVDAPVVAASANRAQQPPPNSGDEVLAGLKGRFDLLLDAGTTRYVKPSTIVRVKGGSYEVLREGVYDAGIIERLSTLRVLFVCTGNTCRSPMAQGIARNLLAGRLGCTPDELAERGVVVSSAGTAGGYGEATEHAVRAMAKRGIDISNHHSSCLSEDIIRQADHIFVMTYSHRDAVLEIVPSAEERVTLLLEGDEVNDPVGGDDAAYESCARLIERGVRDRLKEVTL